MGSLDDLFLALGRMFQCKLKEASHIIDFTQSGE